MTLARQIKFRNKIPAARGMRRPVLITTFSLWFSLAGRNGFYLFEEPQAKNGFVARVATRRGLFQWRHKGVYLRPESLTERVEEVLLLCGHFDLISGDLNLRYQAYESRTA